MLSRASSVAEESSVFGSFVEASDNVGELGIIAACCNIMLGRTTMAPVNLERATVRASRWTISACSYCTLSIDPIVLIDIGVRGVAGPLELLKYDALCIGRSISEKIVLFAIVSCSCGSFCSCRNDNRGGLSSEVRSSALSFCV
jgi:hypothetical protein